MSTQAVEAAMEAESKGSSRDGVVVVPIFGGADDDQTTRHLPALRQAPIDRARA